MSPLLIHSYETLERLRIGFLANVSNYFMIVRSHFNIARVKTKNNWRSLFLTSTCARLLSSASRQLWRLSARPGLQGSTRETTSESFSVATATRRTRPPPRLSPIGALKTTTAATWTTRAIPWARSRDPAPLGPHLADGRRRSWNW